jgi:hypothetical protein
MATENPLFQVQGQRHAAMGTANDMTTVATLEKIRETAAVEKYKTLAPSLIIIG